MTAALVPELSVTDWRASRRFYTDVLGFSLRYERPEEGFCYLALGAAELMIDQIGVGRDFSQGGQPLGPPLGRGVNLQIRVDGIAPIIQRLTAIAHPIFLGPEDRWYRRGAVEVGNRQIIIADPDGYLLRFYEDLGTRPA